MDTPTGSLRAKLYTPDGYQVSLTHHADEPTADEPVSRKTT